VEYTGDDWAGLRSGRVAPSQLNSVEPAPGVVGMGGSALGLPAMFTGGVSGFSVGAIQRALTNWAEGGAWYEGVVQNAIVGAVGGAVAGGVVGAMNPDNLPAKVLVGGFVGGGVSAGTQVAFNVAGGRPWNEGVGTAFGMGFANGAIDAFTDYYGDMLVERAMTPRSARGAVDDVDGWRRPGVADDADGRLRRWTPEEWGALAVRKAMDVFRDPNASRTERFWAQNKLLDTRVRGVWQGGESIEQMRHRHPTDPDAYWDPTAGRAHEGRWRSRETGRIVAGDAPEGVRTRVGVADTDTDTKAKMTLYQGIAESRLQKYQTEGLEMSPKGFRAAGLYTTPNLEESVGWVFRHGSDKNYILRYEIDSDVWLSLRGKETGMNSDDNYMYRVMAEDIILEARPDMVAGFPRSQAEFDALLAEVHPELAKYVEPVEAVDYLRGEVPLVWESASPFGYEYVFKSHHAIQDVLSNPSATQIWITEITSRTELRDLEWRPITFPRR
jgi:hypothetical protein